MNTRIEEGVGMEPSLQEQQQLDSLPVISDPEDFLMTQEVLKAGKLETFPDLDLLKFIITLPRETGLIYHAPQWFIIVGKSKSVFVLPPIPFDNADIWLHSHPLYLDSEDGERFLPSPEDFHGCPLLARNFIVSTKGVTQYYPLLTDTGERDLYAGQNLIKSNEKMLWMLAPNQRLKSEDYISLLSKSGAQYTLHPFEELNNEKLSTLFYGNDKIL